LLIIVTRSFVFVWNICVLIRVTRIYFLLFFVDKVYWSSIIVTRTFAPGQIKRANYSNLQGSKTIMVTCMQRANYSNLHAWSALPVIMACNLHACRKVELPKSPWANYVGVARINARRTRRHIYEWCGRHKAWSIVCTYPPLLYFRFTFGYII